MLNQFISETNWTTYVVIFTLCNAMVKCDSSKIHHRLLICILYTSFVAEIAVPLIEMRHPDNYPNGFGYGLLYMLVFPIHQVLWLWLLLRKSGNTKFLKVLVPACIIFTTANIITNQDQATYYSFVAGTFLYIIMFSIITYKELSMENLAFFLSNDFMVLFTPVFSFIGLSLMLAFGETALFKTPIINKMPLYLVIVNYVNIIYYTGLNLYIFREKKVMYAR
jgi:hypothetical protein